MRVQGPDGFSLSDLWIDSRHIVSVAWADGLGLAAQPVFIFALGFVFSFHHVTDDFRTSPANTIDQYAAQDSVGLGCSSFFSQLVVCYLICRVKSGDEQI